MSLKDNLLGAWQARNEQERRMLSIGAAVVLAALVWLILLEPALDGRKRLNKEVPELRQQVAQIQSLALEASELARRPAVAPVPMTREALVASLAQRSLSPTTLTVAGEQAKLVLAGVSYANLMAWLDTQRREQRIDVQEAQITAPPQAPPGTVDATLNLRQHMDGAR